MSSRKTETKLVYSSDTFGNSNNRCRNCLRELRKCICSEAKPILPVQGTVYIHRETKGRKGAGVTLVNKLILEDSELKQLAKQLKKKCGVGGSVKQGVIEIQGDQRNLIKTELEKLGFAIKLAGG